MEIANTFLVYKIAKNSIVKTMIIASYLNTNLTISITNMCIFAPFMSLFVNGNVVMFKNCVEDLCLRIVIVDIITYLGPVSKHFD